MSSSLLKCLILVVASCSHEKPYHDQGDSLVWTGPQWKGPLAVAKNSLQAGRSTCLDDRFSEWPLYPCFGAPPMQKFRKSQTVCEVWGNTFVRMALQTEKKYFRITILPKI